jgi:hypothetical protein
VLVTAEHYRRSLKHDAASIWLEDVTSSSFKVCMRELQNFDGPHQDIYVVSLEPQNFHLYLLFSRTVQFFLSAEENLLICLANLLAFKAFFLI